MKKSDFSGNIIKSVIYNKKVNLKIVVLADLHDYTVNNKLLIRLVNKIKELKPNLILIAGDIFNGGSAWEGGIKLLKFREFISYLSLISPVCITLGNHDLRGMNDKNKKIRLKKFYDLGKLNLNRIFPLYNDVITIDNIDILGYVPRFELMEKEGLKTQIHGIAHDKFISDYNKEGVKFKNNNNFKIYLGHDPHLIAASENGIGLGDLSCCDFFVSGHMHNGYKHLSKVFGKRFSKSVELDLGWTEQPTGIVSKEGKQINRFWPPIYGKTNLCRGIVYIDSLAQQKVLDIYNKFYINESSELNTQKWKEISDTEACKLILNNSLHPLLISEGVTPTFIKKEKFVNINYIEFIKTK